MLYLLSALSDVFQQMGSWSGFMFQQHSHLFFPIFKVLQRTRGQINLYSNHGFKKKGVLWQTDWCIHENSEVNSLQKRCFKQDLLSQHLPCALVQQPDGRIKTGAQSALTIATETYTCDGTWNTHKMVISWFPQLNTIKGNSIFFKNQNNNCKLLTD